MARHTIVRPNELKRVEIGFRTVEGEWTEPPAYEWNAQHRGGRIQRQAEEAQVFTGDENLVDVKWVVQYRVAEPVTALFGVGRRQPEGADKWNELVRGIAEAALRAELAGRGIDSVLADERRNVESAVGKRIANALKSYETGLTVASVCLGDVHPPLEVVPAFRDVAAALEDKEAKINLALGYMNEAEWYALGEAEKTRLLAEGFQHRRTQHAHGEAKRFTAVADAYQSAPDVTRLRLYLDTVEDLFAGRRKIIVDRAVDGNRRRLFLGPQPAWNPPAAFFNEDSSSFDTQDFGQP